MEQCKNKGKESSYKHPVVKAGDVVKCIDSVLTYNYYLVCEVSDKLRLHNLNDGCIWSSLDTFGIADYKFKKVTACFTVED